ncbi:MAG: 3-phosphoshikimate 1-carboxyvinyltransferase, partial [Burkholderiales bacterium]|nr:3-phosphoshikimate 1-carboxyvinyltransferase [Burkholderiales bacterium]
MSNLKLNPITVKINAILELPGSKSIANRVLLLAALSNGISVVSNIPEVSEDVMLMCDALQKLGVIFNKLSAKNGIASYQIIGCNGEFPVKSAEIFCGNSGTTIRFLCAALAIQSGHYILTGIQRMKERPVGDLVDALRQIGADIEYIEDDAYPPLLIKPFKYNNCDRVLISGHVSSQYISALLMALPILKQNLDIIIKDELISKPYVEITVRLLGMFGCRINLYDNADKFVSAYIFNIANNLTLNGLDYFIEPDASSASYFLAFGALNGRVSIKHLSNNSL